MSRDRGFPDNGELVVCTVDSVKNYGAFVTLDEYDGKQGFVHVRDVATGWVKYIRDYVREGQKIVCKVLGVDSSKGHIDLSLKSVNDHQKREKIQQWKNENKAEKLMEIVAERLSISVDDGRGLGGDLHRRGDGEHHPALRADRRDPRADHHGPRRRGPHPRGPAGGDRGG